MSRLCTINISEDIHRQTKALAALQGLTVRAYVEAALADYNAKEAAGGEDSNG